MINQERVCRMTKMAAYEEREGKKDRKITSYFCGDYLTKQMLITFLCGTIAFVILFGAYAIYHFETMIQQLYSMNITAFAGQLIVAYAIFLGVLLAVTAAVYGSRYRKAQMRQENYRRNLLQLAGRYRERRGR